MSLQHIKCPHCSAEMGCLSSLFYHISGDCQTEEHKIKKKEFDAGIIHDWKCKIPMIDVPKLKINIPFPRNKE